MPLRIRRIPLVSAAERVAPESRPFARPLAPARSRSTPPPSAVPPRWSSPTPPCGPPPPPPPPPQRVAPLLGLARARVPPPAAAAEPVERPAEARAARGQAAQA